MGKLSSEKSSHPASYHGYVYVTANMGAWVITALWSTSSMLLEYQLASTGALRNVLK